MNLLTNNDTIGLTGIIEKADCDLTIEHFSADLLPAIVRVHQAAFPHFFLSQLGPAFLTSYYQLVADFPGGILLVARQQEAIVGFVAGFLKPTAFYQYMSRAKWKLLIPILRGVLVNPRCIARVLSNGRKVREQGNEEHDSPAGIACELSSIAVDPSYAGKGCGKELLQAFTAQAVVMNANYILLTTDANNNERVNTFYLRQGFVLRKTFVASGQRTMNEYQLLLKNAPNREL